MATGTSQLSEGADSLVSGQQNLSNGISTIQSKLPSSAEISTNKSQLNTLKANNTGAVSQLQSANQEIEKNISIIDTQLNSTVTGKEGINIQTTKQIVNIFLIELVIFLPFRINFIDTFKHRLTSFNTLLRRT